MWHKISKQIAPLLKKHFLTLSFWLLGLTLPWQLGKHFWPEFSYISGLRIDYLSPTFYLADLVLLVTLIGFIFKNGVKLKRPRTIHATPGVVALLLINFIVAGFPGLFFYRLYQYLKLFVVFVLFQKANKGQITSFFQGLAISGFLALVLAISQIINQGSLQGLWYFLGERSFTLNSPGISTVSINGQKLLRAYAFFSHPNSLAGFFLPLVFVYLTLKKPVVAIISLFLVILSFSKFHLVVLAFGLWFFLKPKKQPCQICLFAKVGFIFWLVWFSLLINNNPESLDSRLVSIWPTLQFIGQHPLGTGLGHYLEPKLSPFPQPIHNVFLLITLEWGWFIWIFIFAYIKKLFATFTQNRLGQFLAIVLFLTMSFDHYLITLNQNLMLLGVLLGLFIGSWSRRQIPN